MLLYVFLLEFHKNEKSVKKGMYFYGSNSKS